MAFDYTLDYKHLNLRTNPELYRVGRGEQGVLLVEPYKSEILPFWKFKTEADAIKSSEKIYALFTTYLQEKDFVGADMARKFLQMGYTRARRYANHKSGTKYTANPQHAASAKEEAALRNNPLPQEKDWENNEKAKAAEIFKEKWIKARENPEYLEMKVKHQEQYGK